MYEDANRGEPDRTVERLTSEVADLRREVAALTCVVHELQAQQLGRRLRASGTPRTDAPARASGAPAAIMVLIAVALLSWQLIVTPRAVERELPQVAVPQPAITRTAPLRARTPTLALAMTPPPIAFQSRTVERAPFVYRGTLSVAADQPEAEVFVNRRRVGVAPVRVRNLKAGSHLVWIESQGHRRWTRVVTVPAERVTRVKADLEPVIFQ